MELAAFRAALDGWLDEHRDELAPAYAGAAGEAGNEVLAASILSTVRGYFDNLEE